MNFPVSLKDFEKRAKHTLPKYVYDYFSSGSTEEQTLKDNCDAFKRSKVLKHFVCNLPVTLVEIFLTKTTKNKL